MESINEIISINPNIILLVTNYKDDKEEEFLENELNKRYKGIPTFYFKNSKIVNNAANYGLSFTELYNESSLSKKELLELF